MSGGERPSTGIDRAVSMLRLLLASASEDELSRAQALGALVRCPLTMTTRIGGSAPRLTRNEQGELSAALFTGPDALTHAAQRFGWGELDLEFGAQTLPGADALRRLLEEGAQRVAIDPGAEHAVELLREEIEVLVSSHAERPSAASAKLTARRESPTQPIEREEKTAASNRESRPLAEIDDPFVGKETPKPPPRAASRPLGDPTAKRVPRNMESEPFSSVHPATGSARAGSSTPPKKVSTKRPPRKDTSGAVAARRVSPIDDTQPFEAQGNSAARRTEQPVIVLEGADAEPAAAPSKRRMAPERAQTEPMTPHAKAAARATIAERVTEPLTPIAERATPRQAESAAHAPPQPPPPAGAPPVVRSADDYDFGEGASTSRPLVAADEGKPPRSSLPASRKRNDQDDDRLTMPESVTRESLRVALEHAEVEVGTRERLLATIVGNAEPPNAATATPSAVPEPPAAPAFAPPPPPSREPPPREPSAREPSARAPSATPAARAPAARGKPEARESTVSVTAELREPDAAIDDKTLRALADSLRLYPEVEWACHVSDGEGPALIGVRIEPSFLTRTNEIATALHDAGGDHGLELRVFLLTDAARMREARAKGKVFFPWRTRDPKRETKQ